MQKVLIISYFFPPCNLTAAQRSYYWAKQLKKFDYYPIIVTRNWDIEIKNQNDINKKSGVNLKCEETKNYKAYFIPFRGGIKEKVFKSNNNKLKFFKKSLTFIELILQNFFLHTIYKEIYSKCREVLNSDESINKVIVTANPFICFKIGHQLKREFKHISWIADYRDDWTTTELKVYNTFLFRIIKNLERKSEKKWLSNASTFTTVSDYYKNKIEKFISIKGHVLLNGYADDIKTKKHVIKKNNFIITYIGTLYDSQPIEEFISVLINIIDELKNRINIILKFPGLAFNLHQKHRIELLMKGYENNFEISQRLPRNEIHKIIQNSHLMLMVGHKNLKGIPSSKLYEYIGFEKQVILYPDDDDIIKSTLNDVNLGIIPKNKEELFSILKSKIINYEVRKINASNKIKYSRLHQTEKLSKIINNH